MIALIEIALDEKHDREPIYSRGEPIGKTRGNPTREMVIRLRIDDPADVTRIHAAIEDLTRPDETESVQGARLQLPHGAPHEP